MFIPHLGYRESIKCCELMKMVPLARQCSEIKEREVTRMLDTKNSMK